jgi:hypothetical protein
MSAVGVGMSNIAALFTRMSSDPPAAAVACSASRRSSGSAAMFVAAGHDDEGSVGSERRGDSNAKTASGTGDKCCAAIEPRIVWTHGST